MREEEKLELGDGSYFHAKKTFELLFFLSAANSQFGFNFHEKIQIAFHF